MKKNVLALFGALVLLFSAASCSGNGNSNIQESKEEKSDKATEVSQAAESAEPESPITLISTEPVATIFDNVKCLTVIDFNASWCVPCKKFEPVFEAAASSYGKDVKFYSVDIDGSPELANKYGVESIPTVILLRPDGKQVKYVGLDDIYPYEKFDKIIQLNLD